jgi:nucleoside-diphosphate-sugar epimerase
MLVFVTGAAGFIGRAVVQELLLNGHQVLGLARNDASAETITKAGATPHRGDLEDLESLENGAKAADGVIHLAFIHDFSDFPRAMAVDRAAIEAMGKAMTGTGKPLVIASGTMMLQKGQLATEDSQIDTSNPFSVRAQAADVVYKLAKDDRVRGSVIRLTPTVHDVGDKGMIPGLINAARQNKFVVYTGDGSARWPAVHRLDAAVLFRLALEKGKSGATYHAVADQGVSMKDITSVIAKNLELPTKAMSEHEAAQAIGFLGHLVGSDNPTSSEKTQKELGWHPTQIGLLADLEANYFK